MSRDVLISALRRTTILADATLQREPNPEDDDALRRIEHLLEVLEAETPKKTGGLRAAVARAQTRNTRGPRRPLKIALSVAEQTALIGVPASDIARLSDHVDYTCAECKDSRIKYRTNRRGERTETSDPCPACMVEEVVEDVFGQPVASADRYDGLWDNGDYDCNLHETDVPLSLYMETGAKRDIATSQVAHKHLVFYENDLLDNETITFLAGVRAGNVSGVRSTDRTKHLRLLRNHMDRRLTAEEQEAVNFRLAEVRKMSRANKMRGSQPRPHESVGIEEDARSITYMGRPIRIGDTLSSAQMAFLRGVASNGGRSGQLATRIMRASPARPEPVTGRSARPARTSNVDVDARGVPMHTPRTSEDRRSSRPRPPIGPGIQWPGVGAPLLFPGDPLPDHMVSALVAHWDMPTSRRALFVAGTREIASKDQMTALYVWNPRMFMTLGGERYYLGDYLPEAQVDAARDFSRRVQEMTARAGASRNGVMPSAERRLRAYFCTKLIENDRMERTEPVWINGTLVQRPRQGSDKLTCERINIDYFKLGVTSNNLGVEVMRVGDVLNPRQRNMLIDRRDRLAGARTFAETSKLSIIEDILRIDEEIG